MILGAAGASALLLTGCLGGAKGEDFVGYWADDTPRQGRPRRLIAVIKIERMGGGEFVATVLEPIPMLFGGGVNTISLMLRYMPENRLAIERGSRVFFVTIKDGNLMINERFLSTMTAAMRDRPFRRSTREEFDGFPASLAQPQQRR